MPKNNFYPGETFSSGDGISGKINPIEKDHSNDVSNSSQGITEPVLSVNFLTCEQSESPRVNSEALCSLNEVSDMVSQKHNEDVTLDAEDCVVDVCLEKKNGSFGFSIMVSYLPSVIHLLDPRLSFRRIHKMSVEFLGTYFLELCDSMYTIILFLRMLSKEILTD